MSTGNQAYLDNTMLGETVIYCDENGVKHPAIIFKPISDEIVDLLVWDDGIKPTLAGAIKFNHKIEAVPNTWWRRNKF